jgi:hypothetical protein
LDREDEADRGDDEAAAIAATGAATETRQNLVRAEMALKDAERGALAKYQRYTLPGGTNYREVLLTLPAEDRLPVGYSAVQQEGVWKIADNSGNIVMGDILYGATKEIATRNAISYLRSEQGTKPGQIAPAFQSGHWDQRNVLVHLRMNDRVDADGKRVLFVEEVQSDWGQQGRKVGFEDPAKRSVALGEYSAAKFEYQKLVAEQRRLLDESPEQAAALQPQVDEQSEKVERLREIAYAPKGIARAPFVETTDGWLNLGLKQIMLEAVRGGYDSVAFVSGQQSADRYDLSKRVESIVFNKNMDGTFNYQVTLRDTESDELDGDNKTLEQIEETFGKEIAQKMDAATPADTVDATEQEDMFPNELSGLDLKVGGEGMQNFYDKIVPTAMGKLLKKYGGGKLNDVVLPNMQQQEMEADAERMGMTVADVLDLAEDTEYAQAQPGFDITPELVKKLESGLPLFQAMPAAGPARGGFDPSRLTTILNKTADLSTFLHESAHAFLTFYEQMSQAHNAPARIVNDMDELLRWFGIAGATPAERIANWNGMSLDQKRKYHETFAYNFEVYLFEGKAPSA